MGVRSRPAAKYRQSSTAVGGTPSTHILKLPSSRLKRISVNELFMLELARELGVPVVKARLWPVGEENALLVTRFDRQSGARLHQEDFCQATNRSPKTKYEDEGGPTFSELVTVIREESVEPAVDVDVALNWLIFNVLCGNADGHAKNLALIRSGPVRLAPLYDLVCTRYWDNFFGADVAIGVGGQRDPGHIDRSHWVKLAKDGGLGAPFVVRRVEEMVEACPRAAERIAKKLADSGVDAAPFDRLITIISNLCRRAAQLLLVGSSASAKNAKTEPRGPAGPLPTASPHIFKRAHPRAP